MNAPLASRTAVLVCQGRAAAQGRLAVGEFDDPIAARLLRPDELIPVEQVRREERPSTAQERFAYEWVRACAEVIVPRTVAIDQAVTAAGARQVVVVGAGLDSRAWRLPALERSTVYLVDQPASRADAEARSAELKPLAALLVRVAVDLARSDLSTALASAGHDAEVPTTWVWEGVVPYLTREQVRTTLATITRCSAPRSTLIINYQAPSLFVAIGRPFGRLMARLARAEDPMRSEPWRSMWSPKTMGELLRRYAWLPQEDEALLQIAERLKSPTRGRRSLASGRVVRATLSEQPES